MDGVWRGGKFILASTLEERERILKAGILAVAALIEESVGVDGLHLNGDCAPWPELRTGGRLEDWLIDFDDALKLVRGERS